MMNTGLTNVATLTPRMPHPPTLPRKAARGGVSKLVTYCSEALHRAPLCSRKIWAYPALLEVIPFAGSHHLQQNRHNTFPLRRPRSHLVPSHTPCGADHAPDSFTMLFAKIIYPSSLPSKHKSATLALLSTPYLHICTFMAMNLSF